MGFWPTVKTTQKNHINQYHHGGGKENPTITGQRGHRCAEHRPSHIAQIHKRLVITEDAAGDVVAGMTYQQRLHRRHHCAIGKTKQKAQYAQLRRIGDKRHADKQQQRNYHCREQDTLRADAIAESS